MCPLQDADGSDAEGEIDVDAIEAEFDGTPEMWADDLKSAYDQLDGYSGFTAEVIVRHTGLLRKVRACVVS